MKIVIFGASGGIGRQVVLQALDAGHKVTAFVRGPEKLCIQHPNLNICQDDVRDFETVGEIVPGQDAVISALGPSRPPVPGMMETAARNILDALQKQGVKRLLSTTGAGVWDPRDQPRLFDKAMKALLTLMAGDV